MMLEGTLHYCIPLNCATNFSQPEISKMTTVKYFWNNPIPSTNYGWPDRRKFGLHNINNWTIPSSTNDSMRRRRAGTLIGFSKRMDATTHLSMDNHPIVSTPALTRSSNGSTNSSNDSTCLSPLPEQVQTFSTPPSSIHNQPMLNSPDMSKRGGGLCIQLPDLTKEGNIDVPSSAITDDGSFTPYAMQTVEPRAPELIVRDKMVSRSSSLRRPRAYSKSASPILPMTQGILTPVSGGQNTAASTPAPTNTLKRSLSTLLKRSTSLVRRNPNTNKSVDMTATPPSPLTVNTTELSPSVNTIKERGYTDALSSSAFNVTITNSIISPLIGNSMVHVKVIVNPDTIIVAPMMRSIVFARARERILTKLFQCGVPFVESKPCKLAIRKQLDNGEEQMVAIENNQAWRNVMDAAGGYEHANSDGVSSPSSVRRVVKLVLHLIPPEAKS